MTAREPGARGGNAAWPLALIGVPGLPGGSRPGYLPEPQNSVSYRRREGRAAPVSSRGVNGTAPIVGGLPDASGDVDSTEPRMTRSSRPVDSTAPAMTESAGIGSSCPWVKASRAAALRGSPSTVALAEFPEFLVAACQGDARYRTRPARHYTLSGSAPDDAHAGPASTAHIDSAVASLLHAALFVPSLTLPSLKPAPAHAVPSFAYPVPLPSDLVSPASSSTCSSRSSSSVFSFLTSSTPQAVEVPVGVAADVTALGGAACRAGGGPA